jgi:signal transduction histidine kinase
MKAREQILRRYRDLLESVQSPLLLQPTVAAQVIEQMNSVLDAVPHIDLSVPVSVVRPRDTEPTQLSVDIGVSRASAGVHPSESLRAATYIFEAAFPVLCDELRRTGTPKPEVRAGMLLNRAIMERLSVASSAYVDFLLQKVHNSHVEERHHLGRELHDRVAPAVLVGLHHLEMASLYLADAPERAEQKRTAAKEALNEALDVIRQLSADSRDSVGSRGLQQALERYLTCAPPEVDTSLIVSGDIRIMPNAYAEELFLVLREATRNALVHSRASSVLLQVEVADTQVFGCVRDNGTGFDLPSTLERRPGIGLISMRERVALLGGTLTLMSKADVGTTVEILVPLPGVLR